MTIEVIERYLEETDDVSLPGLYLDYLEIGRASCRERV